MSFYNDLVATVWLTAVAVTIIIIMLSLVFHATKKRRVSPMQQIKPGNDLTAEAQNVLLAAQEQAAKVIREAKLFNRQIGDKMAQALSLEGDKAGQAAQQMAQQLYQETRRQLKHYTQEYEKGWEEALANLRHEAAEQLKQIRAELNKTRDRQLETLRAELDEFRRQEEKNISRRLKKKLPAIMKELIGRSIPIAVHEELVCDALEKAYHDNVWQNEPAEQ